MKKILFIALCAMLCLCSANAQQNVDVVADTAEVVDAAPQAGIPVEPNMLSMVENFAPLGDNKPLAEQLYPLGKGLFKKHHIEQALEICPSITKSKVSQSEMLKNQNVDEVDDTGLGLNFGYSVIFIPGYEEAGQLRMNKFGFAYSVGFIASFTSSDRYGTLCDFMAKVGFETCHNRKMGIGFDFLYGYGKSSGDVFYYHNIVEDTAPLDSRPYTEWGYKYGGQLWAKTGLFGGASSHTDVLLFARLIKSPDPKIIPVVTSVTYNLWREENWSFGVILRYRM